MLETMFVLDVSHACFVEHFQKPDQITYHAPKENSISFIWLNTQSFDHLSTAAALSFSCLEHR